MFGMKKKAPPASPVAGLNISAYVDMVQKSVDLDMKRMEQRMRERAARIRWPVHPAMFKLDQRCTHCGSHDYVKWHDRTQCAFCRIPAAKQPARINPDTHEESRRAARAAYYRGMTNAYNRPY